MAFSLLYTIQDEKGKTSITEIKLPEGTAFSDVTLFASELAKLINPVITGKITRIGVAFTLTLPAGLRAAPAANADVEEGARFQYGTTNGFYSGMRIPTFDEVNIVPGTKEVDQTVPDVAAYITAMVNGIDLAPLGGNGIIQPCDSRGEDLTALEFAREQFLSSRGS